MWCYFLLLVCSFAVVLCIVAYCFYLCIIIR
nr:MAG TPA: hypothetical protein [Caudoviricetes sp.]